MSRPADKSPTTNPYPPTAVHERLAEVIEKVLPSRIRDVYASDGDGDDLCAGGLDGLSEQRRAKVWLSM